MPINLTSPVSGSAIAGFTAPTYTVAVDAALSSLQKQWYVSALGGTQAGVTAHTATRPFTFTAERPRQISGPAAVRTGSYQLTANVRNKWKFILRKGGNVNAPLAIPGSAIIRVEIDVAAGMEDASPSELRAMMSFLGGAFSANADSWSLSMLTGSF